MIYIQSNVIGYRMNVKRWEMFQKLQFLFNLDHNDNSQQEK